MTSREHLLAVVEPTASGDSTLDAAQALVARGGKATVLVLRTDRSTAEFRRFADSENLAVDHGESIAIDRLLATFAARVGGADTTAVMAEWPLSSRDLIYAAADSEATAIAIPQQLAGRGRLRRLVSDSPVPVLVTPSSAA